MKGKLLIGINKSPLELKTNQRKFRLVDSEAFKLSSYIYKDY